MEQFSVGGDLFATLAVVGLLTVFIAALVHSYHVYAERKSAHESFDLALDTAEDLKNRVLRASPGSIEWAADKLEGYSGLLAQQGVKLRVEIRSPGGEVLHTYGPEQNPLGGYFSPPASASLPVAVVRGQGSVQLCELIVRIWSD